ncbi:MAG: hypothetical protein AAF039_08570 [Bacteroidota bacterium]
MQTKADYTIKLPFWWFVLPAYLTLWTLAFSIYSFVDGNEMMQAFGIDTEGASDFIMLNSGGRYVALAMAMLLGIWVFRTYRAILIALLARLTMDVLDLYAGLQTGIIADITGVVQSFLMFLLPNLISILLLIRFYIRQTRP